MSHTGVLNVTESGDVGSFTGTVFRLESDVLLYELSSAQLIQMAASSDSVQATDSVTESPDMTFEEVISALDVIGAGLIVSQATADVVQLQDLLQGIHTATTTDTITVSDNLATTQQIAAVDIVNATELISSNSTLSVEYTTQVILNDSLATTLSAISSDTVSATDTVLGAVVYGKVVADDIVISDVVSSNTTILGALADSALVSEQITTAAGATTVDIVNALELVVGLTTTTATMLVDSIDVADSLAGTITVYAPVLTDTATVIDVMSSALRLVGVLSDVILAGDTLHDAARTVHVVNAETGAVSTYVLTPTVEDVAFFRGTLYLAGPAGLYAVDAVEDEDGKVVWTMETGLSDFGTDLLKRIHDVNIQMRTDADTTVQVIESRYGAKRKWNYLLPPRTRENYRDGVVKVGMELKSVYYALGLKGTAPAEIDKLRVSVVPLYRRR